MAHTPAWLTPAQDFAVQVVEANPNEDVDSILDRVGIRSDLSRAKFLLRLLRTEVVRLHVDPDHQED